MQPASPEPSRDRAATREFGTATQGQAGPQPAPRDATPHRVEVNDQQAHPVDLPRLDRLARHVLAALEVPAELELSVTFVDTAQMAQLNRAHMDADHPTDVLAFPIDAPADVVSGVPGVLGDVVVCPAVAADQAARHDRTAQDETDLLLVHGILHLLGHDHADPGERAEMFGLTDTLLDGFGNSSRASS